MLPFSASLAVFYLLYKAVVRNDAHLNVRRFTILGILVFSIVLPFLSFQMPSSAGWGVLNMPLQNLVLELPVFVVGDAGAHAMRSYGFFEIIGWIYLVGVLLLVGRGLFGILRLEMLAKTGKLLSTKTGMIISNPNIPTAFSFFSTIFMPETPYSDHEKEMMLAHEHAHVKQKHSWDLMLMNLICAVQFFNPFVWLLKREMRLNHEYLADKEALKNNENPEHYFELLLREIVGKQPILVHSFNYSPLKHRIMMQLSKPAKVLNQVRYLAFLPVVLALTFLFACQTESKKLEDILPPENVKIVDISEIPQFFGEPNDSIYVVVDNNPGFPGSEEARMRFLQENMRYPAEAREKGIQGTVFVSFVVEKDGSLSNARILRGIGAGCDEEVLRVVEMMPKWTPGKKEGVPVRVQFNMPIRFTLSK